MNVHVEASRQRFRNPARQRAERPHQRAGEVVAGEGARQPRSRFAFGERRLLDRQKHADVPGGRVQGADEGHHEQRPERRQAGEADSRRRHQGRSGEQHALAPEAMTPETDHEGQQRRADERGGDRRADAQRREAEVGEVTGEHHAHHSVGESSQAASGDQPARVVWRRDRHRQTDPLRPLAVCRARVWRRPDTQATDGARARGGTLR